MEILSKNSRKNISILIVFSYVWDLTFSSALMAQGHINDIKEESIRRVYVYHKSQIGDSKETFVVPVKKSKNNKYSLTFDNAILQEDHSFYLVDVDDQKSVGFVSTDQKKFVFQGFENNDFHLNGELNSSSVGIYTEGKLKLSSAMKNASRVEIHGHDLKLNQKIHGKDTILLRSKTNIKLGDGAQITAPQVMLDGVDYYSDGSLSASKNLHLRFSGKVENNLSLHAENNFILDSGQFLNKKNVFSGRLFQFNVEDFTNEGDIQSGYDIQGSTKNVSTGRNKKFQNFGSLRTKRNFSLETADYKNEKGASIFVGGVQQINVEKFSDAGSSYIRQLSLIDGEKISFYNGHDFRGERLAVKASQSLEVFPRTRMVSSNFLSLYNSQGDVYICSDTAKKAEILIDTENEFSYKNYYVKRYASKKNNSEYNIKEEREDEYNKSDYSLSAQFNFEQDPSYNPAFKQYRDGLFIKAEGNLDQKGNITSNATSINCQAGGKLISTGKVDSGIFSFNHNSMKATQAENQGIFQSSGWMNIDIERDFVNHGPILAQNLMLKALSFENTQSIKWGDQAIIETQEQSKNLGKMEGGMAFWRAQNFENFGSLLVKDLIFDIQGKWKNAHNIESQHSISIRASDLDQQGNLESKNALMIADNASLQGTTNLTGSLDLQVQNLNHSGQTKGENISCYTEGEFNSSGPLEAEKVLAVSADKLNNSSILKGEEVSLNTSEFNNQKSGVISATNAILKTKTLDNTGHLNIVENGSIHGEFLSNSGTIEAKNFSIELSHNFYNSGSFNIIENLLIDAYYNTNFGYINAKDILLKGTVVSNLWSLKASNSVSVESNFYLNAGLTTARQISVDSLVALNTGLMAGENISMRGLLVANAGGVLGRNVSMKGILVGNFGLALAQNVSMTGVGCVNTGLMGGMTCSMTGLEVDNYGIMAGKNVLQEQFTYEGLARAVAQELGITPTTLFQKGWALIMGDDGKNSENTFGNVGDYLAAGWSLYNGDYISCISNITGIRYEDLQLLDAAGEYFGYFGIPSQIEAAKNSKIALDVFSYLETAYPNFEQYTSSIKTSQLSKKWEELNQLLNNRLGCKIKQAGFVYGQNIFGKGQNIEHSGSTTGSSHVQYIADKDLSLTGTINGNANVQGGESLNIHDLQGEGSLEGTAPTVVLSGEITRSNPTDSFHLHAQNLSNTSNIKAGDIQLNVEENLDNSGSLDAEKALAISADILNNSNKLEGEIVILKVRKLNNEKQGAIIGINSPESIDNAGVYIQAEVARNDGTIITEQAVLEIKSFDNSGHLNILNNGSFQGNSLVNTGTTKASNFFIESSQRFYNTGSLDVPGNLVIDAGYNTNFGDITAKNAHLEGVVVSNSGEIKTTNSLGIKGEVVRNFGSVNGGENLEIIASQHYEDSEHSLNSAGKTNVIIAANNQGFNGHLTGGEAVVVELKDMSLRNLLNQVEAPIIQANLREGNIVIEDDLIIKNSLHLWANRFENKAKLTANKDFDAHIQTNIINDGSMSIRGNGFLEGETVANYGALEAADLHVKGNHILSERQLQRRAIAGGYADILQKEATMHASSGNLKVEAKESLYGRGATFEAKGSVTLSSQGTLYLGAQQTESEVTNSGRGFYYHSYALKNDKTQVKAGQRADILSGKVMVLEGVDVNSGADINVKSAETLEIKPVYDITQAEQSVTSRSGFFRKKKTTSTQTATQTIVRDTFKSGGKTLLLGQTDVHLQTPDIESKGSIEIQSLQGKIYLESAKSSHMVSQQKQSKSLVWQSQEKNGHYDEKAELPHIRAQGGLTISGAQGVEVDYVGNLDILQNDPNTAWIKALRRDPQATWNYVIEEHKKWKQKVQGLTGPAAAVIALAIGIATQGMGAGLISGLTTNGTIGAMASAGFTSMASQASLSLINNQGNLSKTFKELGSSQQIRSFATSIISAGITQGLSTQLNLSTRATTFTQHLQKNVVTSGTSAGLSILIQKQDVKDALFQAARGIGSGALGGVMANTIGTAYSTGDLNWVTHKLVHGALGAFTGAIMGDDPAAGALAGALGGIASEIIADAMLKGATEKALEKALKKAAIEGRPLAYKDVLQAFETEADKVVNVGRMGAAMAAFALNQEVNIASSTATNALDNNFIPFVMVGLSVASGLYSGYEVYSAYKERKAKGALEELAKQGVINVAGGVIAKLTVKSATAILKVVLDKNPTLAMVFSKASRQTERGASIVANPKVAQPTVKIGSTGENLIRKSKKIEVSGEVGKRYKNRISNRGEPGSVAANSPGTTIKKYGNDGKVQKEFNKGHGNGPNIPKNERTDHVHDHKPNPYHPEGDPTRQAGRPLRNKDKLDFGLIKK